MTDEYYWQDCHFLRHINRDECVIRLASSGAILCVSLAAPLDATRACMISALKPARARVLLGELHMNKFLKCQLDVEWPVPVSLPDPARFVRRLPLAKRKRRRLF